MKSETLRALLVDNELGELAPDTKELLEAYLAAVPAARAESESTRQTLSIAREATRAFPEMVYADRAVTERARRSRRDDSADSKSWDIYGVIVQLIRAAALITVAVACWWIGFQAGVKDQGTSTQTVSRPVDHRFENLWTRYQVAYDPQRGSYVVEKQP